MSAAKTAGAGRLPGRFPAQMIASLTRFRMGISISYRYFQVKLSRNSSLKIQHPTEPFSPTTGFLTRARLSQLQKNIYMGKILVLFQSNTGNTAKMAALVAEGAGRVADIEVRVKKIEDADAADLKWCDGIALGAPTNFGTVPWKMKKWWDDLVEQDIWPCIDGKFGCSFSSAGSIGGGQELNCMTLNIILMNFGCLVFGLTDYTGPGQSAHYGVGQQGEPRTDGEKEACSRMGQRLAEWVSVYIDKKPESHPLKQSYKRLPSDF